jgi:integrase
MALSESTLRYARGRGKNYILNDTKGLALRVKARGAKLWHVRFSWGGKQCRMSLGAYPALGLKDARDLRDEAQALLAKGIDPRAHRRQQRAAARVAGANTFEAVFRSWRDFKALGLEAGRQSTLSQINRIFPKDVLPWVGTLSIFQVTRTELVQVLRRVEHRGALSTAEKIRTWLDQLFLYAMVEVNLEANPAGELDMVALPQPAARHNPYLTMGEMPLFLGTLRRYGGDINTLLGIRLLLLTGVRTIELRSATPEQFKLDVGLWIIPCGIVKQLKVRQRKERKEIPPYIVPLSRQAIVIVQYLLAAMQPAQRYLLPHRSDPLKRISENTLNGGLHRMGYQDQLTGHGIRATLSTALNELGYEEKWVEAQISHADSDPYNHAKWVEERRRMMQDWADRMDHWESQGLEEAPSAPVSEFLQKRLPRLFLQSDDGSIQSESDTLNTHTRDVPNSPGTRPVTPAPMMIVSRSDQRPQPVMTDIQRERAQMLATFEAPHNLPLPVFAKLTGKSRHQINREIQGGRLLSLNLGNRGQRIPDWQLDPVRQQLIHTVLERAKGVDRWTLYRTLSEPMDRWQGRVPVEAVTLQNLQEAAGAVFSALGVNG